MNGFRDEVREFLTEHAPDVKPRAGVRSPETEAELAVLRAWTAKLFDAGYAGADWPVEYGGTPGHDVLRDVVVAEEVARAGALQAPGGSMLAAQALLGFGTEEQRRRYLPRIRSGEDLWCQLFSEPGAGSDLASLRTKAVLEGDHYVVNGQKVWTTNGQWADLGYLLARTDPAAPKHKGITAFALDMRLPGVTVRPLREITGTSDFNEVFFDDVRVPVEAVIGKPGQGWQIANTSLAHERSGVGASVVTLERNWSRLRELAAATGRLDDTETRDRLAAFLAEIQALSVHTRLSLARWREGAERALDAPVAKLAFSELNLRLAEYALSLQGAEGVLTEGDPGVVDDGSWQDAYLYARAYTIAGGSSEIMRNLIAERGLGLPREQVGR
ncbi:acyl-CoA dehydrogenase family protein [Amycolatopsis acidiphila]|uniref:Acyl-CoA dehydrogenase n=1 Tax=Amycolatopsis acidiphila TaxID=715473 RepID=A0A557ZZJ6_9PSEU|nr:acyl-CoA dehydrogenase family protein [Amycolatopsis acidiphila]TVT17438.1 acyl-CoA dehydrogenase [Amycolatopsis acidiphila]UIJ57287.1 acyl-CoA dehydrogenase family protein [Amycolatopsis acidiphila]GHG52270.1 acyl-CoA dehydrogenase [Amycolatopsis acidiphila]